MEHGYTEQQQYKQALINKHNEVLNAIETKGITIDNLEENGINADLFNNKVNGLVSQWVSDLSNIGEEEAEKKLSDNIEKLCKNNGEELKKLKQTQEQIKQNILKYINENYKTLEEKEYSYFLTRIDHWITNDLNEQEIKDKINVLCEEGKVILKILSTDDYDRLSKDDKEKLHNDINNLKDQKLKKYLQSTLNSKNQVERDISKDFLENLLKYNEQSNNFKTIISECLYKFLSLDIDLNKKGSNIGSEIMKAMMKKIMPGKGDEKNISQSTEQGDMKKGLDIPAVTLFVPTSINPLSLIMFFTINIAAPAAIPVLAPFMLAVAVGFKFNPFFGGKKLWIFSCESPFMPNNKENNAHIIGGTIESKFLYVMIVDKQRNTVSYGKISNNPVSSNKEFGSKIDALNENKSYLEQLNESYPDGEFMGYNYEIKEIIYLEESQQHKKLPHLSDDNLPTMATKTPSPTADRKRSSVSPENKKNLPSRY